MPVTAVYNGPRALETGQDVLNAIGVLCRGKGTARGLDPNAADGVCERSHSAQEMEPDRL